MTKLRNVWTLNIEKHEHFKHRKTQHHDVASYLPRIQTHIWSINLNTVKVKREYQYSVGWSINKPVTTGIIIFFTKVQFSNLVKSTRSNITLNFVFCRILYFLHTKLNTFISAHIAYIYILFTSRWWFLHIINGFKFDFVYFHHISLLLEC